MPPNVSFVERFEAISKVQVPSTLSQVLQDAYGLAHPELPASDVQTFARTVEQQTFETFNDLQEYHAHIDKSIHKMRSSSAEAEISTEPAENEAPSELPTGGSSMGRYTNATHHADGLFSDVFKAIAPESCGIVSSTESFDKYPFLVALKVTNPSAMEAPHDSKREVRLLEKSRHAHVIELLESFHQAGGRLVLAFPFMPYTLEDQLRKGKLPHSDQKTILSQLMQGLEYVHEQGIIHRDIKPSNILLKTPHGPAYISDFGIAWLAQDPSSEPADQKIMDVGTTSYRPPELMFGNQWYDTSLDMWAAGCVIAQVVSLGSQTLFDSGDLGSDLALIKSIFSTLGTPNLEVWPEAKSLPDWGKMAFREYPAKPWAEVLPGAPHVAIELVQKLIVYERADRMRAANWREEKFFESEV